MIARRKGSAPYGASTGQRPTVSTLEIVGNINDMNREKVESAKLAIGDYILTEVFDGDFSEVLSQNPRKKVSFEEICTHSDLEVQEATLSRWVKAAAFKRECEAESVDVSGLTLSHLTELSRIKDSNQRQVMLQSVLRDHLSIRETKGLVNSYVQATRQSTPVDLSGNITLRKLLDRLGNGKDLAADQDLVNVLSDKNILSSHLDEHERLRLHKRAVQLQAIMGGHIKDYEHREAQIQKDKQPVEKNLSILGQLAADLYDIEVKGRQTP